MNKTSFRQRISAFGLCILLCSVFASAPAVADTKAPAISLELPSAHRVVFQVSENDPALMNLTLNNIVNLESYYTGIGKTVEIELVAYGPGLNMLRADTSPVRARLSQIKNSISGVTFSACNVTLQAMEKAEGKKISVVPEAGIVPAGVVRIMTLEEAGWSYIKP